jgi:LemA protein
VPAQAAAENAITSALRSVFAVAEAYPDLKANTNFLGLQEELARTEEKIAYARQFYNDTVQGYNTRIQTVPTVLIAGPLGFRTREYFETDDAGREPVKVQF